MFSEFLTKDVVECIVNPTYLIGRCDCTLINLVLKTIALIFNTTPTRRNIARIGTEWDELIYDA